MRTWFVFNVRPTLYYYKYRFHWERLCRRYGVDTIASTATADNLWPRNVYGGCSTRRPYTDSVRYDDIHLFFFFFRGIQLYGGQSFVLLNIIHYFKYCMYLKFMNDVWPVHYKHWSLLLYVPLSLTLEKQDAVSKTTEMNIGRGITENNIHLQNKYCAMYESIQGRNIMMINHSKQKPFDLHSLIIYIHFCVNTEYTCIIRILIYLYVYLIDYFVFNTISNSLFSQ